MDYSIHSIVQRYKQQLVSEICYRDSLEAELSEQVDKVEKLKKFIELIEKGDSICQQ